MIICRILMEMYNSSRKMLPVPVHLKLLKTLLAERVLTKLEVLCQQFQKLLQFQPL